jgi:hypothetical protein
MELVCSISFSPPNSDLHKFNEIYNDLLEKLPKEKCNYYIAGDFNINLLNYENHDGTSEFLDTSLSHFTYPTITRPTHFSNTSSTEIDNIFVNNINVEYFSGIIISDLSDHLPVFYISSEKCAENTAERNVTKYYRDINPVTLSNFDSKLIKTHWEDVIHIIDDADVAYNEFSDYFQTLYNDSFPHVSKKFRMIRNTSKPWLSHAVLNSICRKDALYRNFLQKRQMHRREIQNLQE